MIEKKTLRNLGWLGLILSTLLLVVLFHSPAVAQTPRHYREIDSPPLKEIQLPDYERYQLDNGMIVYLVEDHQLPLVKGSAIIRTGSRLEPKDKTGLAGLTGMVMRTGGTKKHSADELNEMLEQEAASVETGINRTSGNASFNALSEDIEGVFNLFAEVIRYPAFAEEKLELAKTQKRGEISRRNDNPGDIASREFRKLIYGETSPYARTLEYETIDNISQEDLINFHQTYFRPENLILGIVGDFEPQQMKTLINQAFADWKASENNEEPPLPSASQKYQTGVFLVEQPQLSQSNVLLGHIGGQLDNLDYPALSIVNGVLNGFGGRLFNQVRSRQGLAYSVYGIWRANYDYPGIFIAGGQTRSESTVDLVKSLLTEIERIRTESITEAELAYAKDSILNSFVFKFENPSQTLSRLMKYEYFGYPEDYIFQYQRGIKNTTIADVKRVAEKYLNPEKIVTLVVGNTNQIQPPLTLLGEKIKVVDISIPQPKRS